MEFKDKIKKLRTEKGLTQAQLADAIFVSRSTVAKWENGLGLPGDESMTLLMEYFGITPDEIATTEPEAVIVEKNRRIRWGLIGSIAGWAAMLVLVVVMYILPFAIHSGDYGFTWDMAAGVYADNTYIDTGDYRIYYFLFEGETEVWNHMPCYLFHKKDDFLCVILHLTIGFVKQLHHFCFGCESAYCIDPF